MNSLMSSRTIAVSSSNRNWASDLVSSVLPTPVGPRNMNEPIGRLGSCRPARERRTALATAATASLCPITRAPSEDSICSSFSRSPSSIRSTGMPVQRLTTWAMSLESTVSLAMTGSGLPSPSASSAALSRFSRSGITP
ncbi:hypothetical protein D3C72_1913390 [compost metagenome]